MEIQPEWLLGVAPHYFSRDDLHDDTKQKRMLRGAGAAPSTARSSTAYA